MCLAHRLAVMALLLPACASPKSGSGSPPDAGSITYANVVDAILVPMLTRNGLPVVPDDNAVLCRRLAVDLTGLAPTADELAMHCAGRSAAEMAIYFRNKPVGANTPDGSSPYVWVNRRWWA